MTIPLVRNMRGFPLSSKAVASEYSSPDLTSSDRARKLHMLSSLFRLEACGKWVATLPKEHLLSQAADYVPEPAHLASSFGPS